MRETLLKEISDKTNELVKNSSAMSADELKLEIDNLTQKVIVGLDQGILTIDDVFAMPTIDAFQKLAP